jgi:hypothetical protein
MMFLDPDNPVIQLCAAGMQVDGEPAAALAFFEQAWAARRDDFDASVAAHFLARHQATPDATLAWNECALRHATACADARMTALLPSLCLNLGESYRVTGHVDEAEQLAHRGVRALQEIAIEDGYTAFVRMGLDRLLQHLSANP